MRELGLLLFRALFSVISIRGSKLCEKKNRDRRRTKNIVDPISDCRELLFVVQEKKKSIKTSEAIAVKIAHKVLSSFQRVISGYSSSLEANKKVQ